MSNQKEIDDLVKLLDQQIKTGTNHVNIKYDNSRKVEDSKVSIVSGMDCDAGDTACKIPNLDLGIDDE